jgi:hypothetical protein
MQNIRKKIHSWGYVLDEVPGNVPFVFGGTRCSLETAADYIGSKNLIYMNSMYGPEQLKKRHPSVHPGFGEGTLSDKYFRHLSKYDSVMCALEHGRYAECAEEISRFSLTHPTVKGAVFDDFCVPAVAGTMISPEQLGEIRDALRSHNPGLKLHIVTFDYQNPKDLVPYLEHFDELSRWCWIPSADYWNKYYFEVSNLKRITGKPVIQGVYIHDFGIDSESPVPMDIFQLSIRKICQYTLDGHLDGFIIPQAGWFSHEKHRNHIQWMKNYIDWFCGTATAR